MALRYIFKFFFLELQSGEVSSGWSSDRLNLGMMCGVCFQCCFSVPNSKTENNFFNNLSGKYFGVIFPLIFTKRRKCFKQNKCSVKLPTIFALVMGIIWQHLSIVCCCAFFDSNGDVMTQHLCTPSTSDVMISLLTISSVIFLIFTRIWHFWYCQIQTTNHFKKTENFYFRQKKQKL